ncbi:MAG: orotate phosphoribosyltransferase [Gammaproteobacteria bacterium]|nr:orotate phosphoribosyltransferase [Gammaproteobacteria bacterium]
MNQTELIYTLYKISAIRFGDFTLKSGQQSSIYLDLRQIISYPLLLRSVASHIWHTLEGHAMTTELICGVPYTALPIATCLSLQHNIPMLMRRKEAKNYGTGKIIEGVFQPGQHCLIIEDIITTGGSIIETVEALRTAGVTVTVAAAFIDRDQGGKQNLQQTNITTHTVFTLPHILKVLAESNIIQPEERTIIHALLNEFA